MRNKHFESEESSVLRTTLQSSTKANQSCTVVIGEGNSTLEQLCKDQVITRKKKKREKPNIFLNICLQTDSSKIVFLFSKVPNLNVNEIKKKLKIKVTRNTLSIYLKGKQGSENMIADTGMKFRNRTHGFSMPCCAMLGCHLIYKCMYGIGVLVLPWTS